MSVEVWGMRWPMFVGGWMGVAVVAVFMSVCGFTGVCMGVFVCPHSCVAVRDVRM